MIHALETIQTLAEAAQVPLAIAQGSVETVAAHGVAMAGDIEPCLTNVEESGDRVVKASLFAAFSLAGGAALSSWWFSRNPRRYPVSSIERTHEDRNRRLRVFATSGAVSAVTAAMIVYEPFSQC